MNVFADSFRVIRVSDLKISVRQGGFSSSETQSLKMKL